MPSRQLKRNQPESDHAGYKKDTRKKAKRDKGEKDKDGSDQTEDFHVYEEEKYEGIDTADEESGREAQPLVVPNTAASLEEMPPLIRIFTKTEDMILTETVGNVAIADVAVVNWHAVSDALRTSTVRPKQPSATPDECMRRWVQIVGQRKAKFWTTEEDTLLLEAVRTYEGQGHRGSVDWAKVSWHMGGSRSYDQCRHRYSSLVTKQGEAFKTGPWTAEEDERLLHELMSFEQTAAQSGTINWAHISTSAFGGDRTANQCKNRWNKTLKLRYDNIRVGPWSSSEDNSLIEAVNLWQEKTHNAAEDATFWEEVSKHLGCSRSPYQCEGRWRNAIVSGGGRRSGWWSTEEDARLVVAVQQGTREDGSIDWTSVSDCFGGDRNPSQCRQHWRNSLRFRASNIESSKTGNWSVEEDQHLSSAVALCLQPDGSVCWPEVVRQLGGIRSVDQCRRRWKGIVREHESSDQIIVASHHQRHGTTVHHQHLHHQAGGDWYPAAHETWSVEEDERLYDGAVNLFVSPGPSEQETVVNWDAVSAHVGNGRTAQQCCMRWEAALAASAAATGEDQKAEQVWDTGLSDHIEQQTHWTLEEDIKLQGIVTGLLSSQRAGEGQIEDGVGSDKSAGNAHGTLTEGGAVEISSVSEQTSAPLTSPSPIVSIRTTFDDDGTTGHVDWTRVGHLMGGYHSDEQCKLRWLELRHNPHAHHQQPQFHHHQSQQSQIDAKQRKGPWSAEEDDLLLEVLLRHSEGEELGQVTSPGHAAWVAAETVFGGTRSKDQCRHRWSSSLRHKVSQGCRFGPWTPDEDKLLMSCIEEMVRQKQSNLDTSHSTNTSADAAISANGDADNNGTERGDGAGGDDGGDDDDDGDYSGESEHIVWREVAIMMNGLRNSTQCRRRYNALKSLSVGATLRTGAWSEEENALLTAAVVENMSLVHQDNPASLDWAAITQRMRGTRSAEQCRHHWMYTLKHKQEGIKIGIWSKDEDELLIQAIRSQGGGGNNRIQWVEVVRRMNGVRSSRQCRDRWKALVSKNPHIATRDMPYGDGQNTTGTHTTSISYQSPAAGVPIPMPTSAGASRESTGGGDMILSSSFYMNDIEGMEEV